MNGQNGSALSDLLDSTAETPLAADPADIAMGNHDDSAGLDVGTGAADTQAAADASGASFAMRDLLRSRGYELPDEIDDDKVIDQLSQWADRADRFSELAGDQDPDSLRQVIDAGRQFMTEREKYEEWKRSVGQTPAPQPAQQTAPVATARPQAAAPATQGGTARPSEDTVQLWQQVCTFDDAKGCFLPKAPGFEGAAEGLNTLMLERRRNIERFSQDPETFIRQQTEAYIQAELEKRMGALQQQINPDLDAWRAYQQQQAVDQFIAPFRAELVNDQGAITPKGQVFEQSYAKLPESMPLQERLQLARNEADLWATRNAGAQAVGAGKPLFTLKKAQAAAPAQQPPAQTQQPAAQTGADKRKTFVDQARQPRDATGRFQRLGDQSGTVTDAQRRGVPQSGALPSFKQLVEQANRRGGPAA